MINAPQHRHLSLGILRCMTGAVASFAILLVTQSAQAQTYAYRSVHSFQGASSGDGASPYAGLVQDVQGNLYGTTTSGGNAACTANGVAGCGTVFMVNPTTNAETILYSFTGDSQIGGNGTTFYDGQTPYGGLVLDSHGNLYGTTSGGGTYGAGIAFELSPPPSGSPQGTPWTETVLHSFNGLVDGGDPEAGLVIDTLGNLYGTTFTSIFELDPLGRETVLYDFSANPYDSNGNPNGVQPNEGTLVRDVEGNLYGTTVYGGLNNLGTVFELAANGTETVLLSFGNGDQFGTPDGAQPASGLWRNAVGNLYGTTFAGGNGYGTVYELNTQGLETVLYSFTGGPDGGDPIGGLLLETGGVYLYGTTAAGGAYNNGTVFKLSTIENMVTMTWPETVLYSFTGGQDGGQPAGAVIADAAGDLYGTTYDGGGATCALSSNGCGTVFRLAILPTTTTTVTSSLNPSTFGLPVTFTASVAYSCDTPPCTPPNGEPVTFKATLGVTVEATGTGTLNGGLASFTTSSLPLGTISVTATYVGDNILAGSTSTALKQVVAKATTTTTLTSSLNPSVYGQPVTFTATVAPEFGGTPTGTLIFYNGTAVLGSTTLSGGVSTITKTLAVGTYSVTAVYVGSTSFGGSTSNLVSQVVTQDNTTMTLASSNPSSTYGQSVTFTAAVAAQSSGSIPTGTVTFTNGTTTLATELLKSGVATYTSTTLGISTASITATYNGSSSFITSSSTISQTVSPVSTSTTVTSSVNPANLKQLVDFTATVVPTSPAPSGTFNGSVTFYNGTTVLATVNINVLGVAKYATAMLPAGTYNISATYSGNANGGISGSTSAVLVQTIN